MDIMYPCFQSLANYQGERNFLLRLREPRADSDPDSNSASGALGDPAKMAAFQITLDTVVESLDDDDEEGENDSNNNVSALLDATSLERQLLEMGSPASAAQSERRSASLTTTAAAGATEAGAKRTTAHHGVRMVEPRKEDAARSR